MNELIRIRKSKGHTQRDAAREMGVSYMTVHCVEKGKQMPRLRTLAKLSKYYGLDPITILQIVVKERQKKSFLLETS